MATGLITSWDDGFGQGLISEDGDGVHVVNSAACTPRLRAKLAGRSIPPDAAVRVRFDVTLTNRAINVDG